MNFNPLVHLPNAYKLGESTIQVSHVGGRNPSTCTVTAASQGLHYREAGIRSDVPPTPIGDTGPSTVSLPASPASAHFLICSFQSRILIDTGSTFRYFDMVNESTVYWKHQNE